MKRNIFVMLFASFLFVFNSCNMTIEEVNIPPITNPTETNGSNKEKETTDSETTVEEEPTKESDTSDETTVKDEEGKVTVEEETTNNETDPEDTDTNTDTTGDKEEEPTKESDTSDETTVKDEESTTEKSDTSNETTTENNANETTNEESTGLDTSDETTTEEEEPEVVPSTPESTPESEPENDQVVVEEEIRTVEYWNCIEKGNPDFSDIRIYPTLEEFVRWYEKSINNRHVNIAITGAIDDFQIEPGIVLNVDGVLHKFLLYEQGNTTGEDFEDSSFSNKIYSIMQDKPVTLEEAKDIILKNIYGDFLIYQPIVTITTNSDN